jgi:hypothetical protein
MVLTLLAQMADDAFGGISNLSTKLSAYLPAEHVASSLAVLSKQLPEAFALPSPAMLLVWSVLALLGLAVLEQAKFQIGRFKKCGKQLPGTMRVCSRRWRQGGCINLGAARLLTPRATQSCAVC